MIKLNVTSAKTLGLIVLCYLPLDCQAQGIQLSWIPNAETDIKYYSIYKDTVNSQLTEIAQVPATESTYIDRDIVIGKNYFYRITAVDSADNVSEFSDEIIVSTNLPTPVELAHFSSQIVKNTVILKWITATELNNYGFEIERSRSNDKTFKKIGFVAGKGTVNEPQAYEFIDAAESAGKYTYRLKQIDLDGSFEYSEEITVEVTVPDKFELSQNYPNPFNPETEFNYFVAENAKISLVIYDLLGRTVKALLNENKEPGYYSIAWDGRDDSGNKVVSGVYFARMIAGSFRQVRKLVLQK